MQNTKNPKDQAKNKPMDFLFFTRFFIPVRKAVSLALIIAFVATSSLPSGVALAQSYDDNFGNTQNDSPYNFRAGGAPKELAGFIDNAMIAGAMSAFSAVMTNLAIMSGPVAGTLGAVVPDILGAYINVNHREWSQGP